MTTSGDEALEPVELIRKSGAVLRMGKAMLSSGTGSYRVKSAMQQVARAFGLDRHEAHVTLTEITTTSHLGSIFRTEVAEVRAVGVNAHRLGELTNLANSLALIHISEPTRLGMTSYAVFCLKKKKT